MAKVQRREAFKTEEIILIDRLMHRQGLTFQESDETPEKYKRGERAEIDPALMEGLDGL
jgi:hypothetical protein